MMFAETSFTLLIVRQRSFRKLRIGALKGSDPISLKKSVFRAAVPSSFIPL